MSYDLSISVKVEGIDRYIDIAYPEHDSPTYNLGAMFRACMDWDYDQHEYYKCSDIIGNIERGIKELTINREEYEKYNPPNGWGDIDGALKTLISLHKCIHEEAKRIPIEHLYFSW